MTLDGGYLEALGDLIISLKHGLTISDESMDTLIEAEPDQCERKKLLMGLKTAGLLTLEQAAEAVERHGLSEA